MSADTGDDWLREALAHAASGGLLAYPTETSWGLGADATQASALDRLRRFKSERGDKPFSVLVSGFDALASLDFQANADAKAMAERFWPGPLTLVLPCHAPWARAVGRPDGGVAVRCSSHPVAMRLCEMLENHSIGPLTATSLNRSGEKPAAVRAEALRISADAGCFLAAPCDAEALGDAPSTIVDTTGWVPVLLRPGAVGGDALSDWVPRG